MRNTSLAWASVAFSSTHYYCTSTRRGLTSFKRAREFIRCPLTSMDFWYQGKIKMVWSHDHTITGAIFITHICRLQCFIQNHCFKTSGWRTWSHLGWENNTKYTVESAKLEGGGGESWTRGGKFQGTPPSVWNTGLCRLVISWAGLMKLYEEISLPHRTVLNQVLQLLRVGLLSVTHGINLRKTPHKKYANAVILICKGVHVHIIRYDLTFIYTTSGFYLGQNFWGGKRRKGWTNGPPWWPKGVGAGGRGKLEHNFLSEFSKSHLSKTSGDL